LLTPVALGEEPTLTRGGTQARKFLDNFSETMTNTANMEARAMFLEGVHSKLLESSHAERAFEVSGIVAQKRRMDGLIELNARRVKRNQDYASLLRIVVFFFVLCSMVMVQRSAGSVFLATAPVVRMIHGDLDAEAFTITGPSEIYDYLDSFAGSVLEDSKCGDGVCDQNEYEYPGFGRFGCQDDCGKYSKTSLISVQLDDFLGASKTYNEKAAGGTWDLSKISRSYSPDYKWNLYSHTMGAYIFEHHQNVTGDKTVVEVPDGKLELRLFQTRQLHNVLDAAVIKARLMLEAKTLPERDDDIADFKYGDVREAIVAATVIAEDVKEHCVIKDAASFDWECLNYPEVDILYKALSSYGVAGSVTRPGNKAPETLVSVDHCKLLPFGLQGVKNATNKQHLKDASLRCSSARRHGDSDPISPARVSSAASPSSHESIIADAERAGDSELSAGGGTALVSLGIGVGVGV